MDAEWKRRKDEIGVQSPATNSLGRYSKLSAWYDDAILECDISMVELE